LNGCNIRAPCSVSLVCRLCYFVSSTSYLDTGQSPKVCSPISGKYASPKEERSCTAHYRNSSAISLRMTTKHPKGVKAFDTSGSSSLGIFVVKNSFWELGCGFALGRLSHLTRAMEQPMPLRRTTEPNDRTGPGKRILHFSNLREFDTMY
jgi:hypothetical protein